MRPTCGAWETIKNESDITSTTQTLAIGLTVFLLLTDLSHMMFKNVKFYISMRNLDFDQDKCSISYRGILIGAGFGVLVVKLGVALVWHFTQSHKTIYQLVFMSWFFLDMLLEIGILYGISNAFKVRD